MRVHILVEDESGRMALEALLLSYREALRQRGHGLRFEAFQDKAELLRKVGPRAAQILADSTSDRVVALPDLHPVKHFEDSPRFAHSDMVSLQQLLRRLVQEALQVHYRPKSRGVWGALQRFYPSALKYEIEMLLLAAWEPLGEHIGVELDPKKWRHPVEEQNSTDKGRPKHKVEELFLTRSASKRAYRDTKDAPAVLRRVGNIRGRLLYSCGPRLECPVFKGFLDWLGEQTGVSVYDSAGSVAIESEKQ